MPTQAVVLHALAGQFLPHPHVSAFQQGPAVGRGDPLLLELGPLPAEELLLGEQTMAERFEFVVEAR